MKLVIFGLTISSSWGNGHATIWRGLCRSLTQRGHRIVFFEKNVPYYAANRDEISIPGLEICLYDEWISVRQYAKEHLQDTDVAMVTSYCPDGILASELVLSGNAALKCFYDLDTPVTLKALGMGRPVGYIGERGLKDFDLVLSYTGGVALKELKTRLGAKHTEALYGSADPMTHRPVGEVSRYKSDLSYLGTYADDRQEALMTLFIDVAGKLPMMKFIIGGSMYPESFPWTNNIWFISHVHPSEHPEFYCSSFFTLNVTRGAMAEMGYCPSGRLFEAAACGTPIISDYWPGLERFFEPEKEIIIAKSTDDVIEALRMPRHEREQIARRARERVLQEHTSDNRAVELEIILDAYYATNK